MTTTTALLDDTHSSPPQTRAKAKRPMVIYHGDCPDGFGAAYAAWKLYGDEADYLPVNHGEPPPDLRGRSVLVADFAYDRQTTEALAEQASSLVVLDHHRSAEAEIGDLPHCVFDMNRSGAVMAWEHLHQDAPPLLLQYVQDRDLWRNQLPESDEVSAALRARPFDFRVWDSLNVDQLRAEGRVLLAYQRRMIERIAAHACAVEVAGIKVPTVNSPVLQSELGDRLAKGHPFAAVWWQGAGEVARWSLRSTPEGLDVSVIASRFGGGGHRTAAGFKGRPPVDGRVSPPEVPS
ncbi:MAG: DHHA1 domain-containing protein [Candidatus Dormibacteraeota bacterium]|nr:DHHA1 domain-containing protein [Candidatus Dormibacteraeota bacterium]